MGVNVIEEQIDPRILETLFANFPNAEIAMLELTDNAIGDRIPGEKMVLSVRVTPAQIKVLNKGGWGMGIDQLRNFMTWGRSEASGIFRFFGQGGKAAIGYLGKKFKVTTFPKDGDRSYIIQENEDWTKHLDGQLKKYPVDEDKSLVFDSGRVEVVIHSLTRRPHIKKLRYLLESTYSPLLQSGELKILFNDRWLLPEVLKYAKYLDFEDETPFGKVWGRLGVKEDGVFGGIRCYSQKRLITQKESFNLDPTKYDLSKLLGEINLDFVPVMPNKISYDKSSEQWKVVEKLVAKRAEPFLAEIRSMGEVPANLKRMTKEVTDFVNKALSADADFQSKGRNPPAKITEITLETAKPIEAKVPKARPVPEPRTPASPDASGIASRLGRIEVEPEAFDEQIRCQITDNKRKAYINTQYPTAKHYWFRKMSWKLYCLESVALELYKDKCASASELVDKITALLSRKFS